MIAMSGQPAAARFLENPEGRSRPVMAVGLQAGAC